MWQLVHQKDTKKFKGTRLSIGSMIRSRKHGVYIIEIDTMGTKVEIEPIYTGPNLEKAINSYTTNLNKLKKF